MAQYKVPQNVETEDKILGPFSIKQFVYLVIAIMWGFLMWRIFGFFLPIAILLIIPVSGIFIALAVGRREEQSFENYFTALIRFMVLPRKRVWMKDDTKDIVKIVPKTPPKPEQAKPPNPEEVKGQLHRLATIIDSRGRLQKNEMIQAPDAGYQNAELASRVIDPHVQSHEVVNAGAVAMNDDMLDMEKSQKAAAVGQLLQNVETDIRAQAVEGMKKAQAAPAPTKPHHDQPKAAAHHQAASKHGSPGHSLKAQAASPNPQAADIIELALRKEPVTVAQIAKRVSSEVTLSPGKTVKLR